MQASKPLGFKATVALRHYVAKEDRWVDKGEVELPRTMAEAFMEMARKMGFFQ